MYRTPLHVRAHAAHMFQYWLLQTPGSGPVTGLRFAYAVAGKTPARA